MSNLCKIGWSPKFAIFTRCFLFKWNCLQKHISTFIIISVIFLNLKDLYIYHFMHAFIIHAITNHNMYSYSGDCLVEIHYIQSCFFDGVLWRHYKVLTSHLDCNFLCEYVSLLFNSEMKWDFPLSFNCDIWQSFSNTKIIYFVLSIER